MLQVTDSIQMIPCLRNARTPIKFWRCIKKLGIETYGTSPSVLYSNRNTIFKIREIDDKYQGETIIRVFGIGEEKILRMARFDAKMFEKISLNEIEKFICKYYTTFEITLLIIQCSLLGMLIVSLAFLVRFRLLELLYTAIAFIICMIIDLIGLSDLKAIKRKENLQ